MYRGAYDLNPATILPVFQEESKKFKATFRNGMRELKKYEVLDTENAFRIAGTSNNTNAEVLATGAGSELHDAARLARRHIDTVRARLRVHQI